MANGGAGGVDEVGGRDGARGEDGAADGLEVRDRKRIGGSYLKSDLVYCDPKLAKERICNLGEVIIQKNPDNLELSKRIKTFFHGTDEQLQMDTTVSEARWEISSSWALPITISNCSSFCATSPHYLSLLMAIFLPHLDLAVGH
ncbi:hypothetical protein LR48_Vigan06g100700 [Vigna angularis]|uniref:Uncharacterized protein n=1 Tax=Phaseolus angularis TaxID=3914 RepID=A0A0L9USK1_PHAAN|nr:hypothetical protein LR48_Vigan06g100700 [Vigna angularis]